MATDLTPRVAETRAKIVGAAHEVFVAQGYRASSLRDVASAAGLSHPGLLKHFASKDDLLAAVVAEFERINEHALLDDSDDGLFYAALAARNERIPGYLALYTALVGEGSTRGHPAHDYMRGRYARLRVASTEVLRRGAERGFVDPGRDPADEAVRLAALWDGLQLLQLYLPDRIDLVAHIAHHQAALAAPPARRDHGAVPPASPHGPLPALLDVEAPEADAGYRVGRERRARILADATTLFARDGFADTSLQGIAARVGVSKSTLLHHYPSKDDLLLAVLAHRDRLVAERGSGGAHRAADLLRGLTAGAAASARDTPGLIEVYAVLSCEALPVDHAAHAFFLRRFATLIDRLRIVIASAQRDGDVDASRDPEREAIRLVALWDGLQYQWLYDRDAVDVAAHLQAYLAELLPASA